jgi:hypothetical protein
MGLLIPPSSSYIARAAPSCAEHVSVFAPDTGKGFSVERAGVVGSSLRVLITYSGMRLGTGKADYRIVLALDKERQLMIAADSEPSRPRDYGEISVGFMNVSRGGHAINVSLIDSVGKTVLVDHICRRM